MVGLQTDLPEVAIMKNWKLPLLWVLAVAFTACAEATPSKKDPDPLQCTDGVQVGAEGECSIPSIGPGMVNMPEGPNDEAPVLDNSDLEEDRQHFLTQEGPGKLRVYVGESIPVGVRAITYVGEPAPGFAVQFKIEGATFGDALSADRAISNEFGVAQVILTAGTRPTHYYVHMTGEQSASLQYTVDVVQRPDGGDLMPPPDAPPGGGIRGECLETQGTYNIRNHYEPGRVFGDGVFGALDQIHQLLANPGGFVAGLISQRIGGFAGDLLGGVIEPVVNYLVDYIVGNYAPDWVQWMLIITEDVSGLLTEMEIEGTMELGPRDPANCTLRGRHRWETLVFIWRAGCQPNDAMCGRFPIPLNQLGVGLSESEFDAAVVRSLGPVGYLEIRNHPMQLNLGVAVIWFVQNVILPQRLEVNSFGELLGLVIPCDAVGDLAADYVSGVPFLGFAVAPLVEEACEAGLEAAGNFLMRMLADSFNVSAFDMAGECKLRDTNGDRSADKIEEGRWTSGLQGDFTGERR